MKNRIAYLTLGLATLFMGACAQLHHVQIGDIDNDEGDLTPFELMVSETGINIDEAASIGKAMVRDQGSQEAISTIQTIIALFQYGPRTGNLVYSDTYTDQLADDIRKKCPSGRLTGLMSIRESRKYPVISGEIVKIKGYCILNKKTGVKS
jgi:hypothetical protein